jgi:hypothetical protein
MRQACSHCSRARARFKAARTICASQSGGASTHHELIRFNESLILPEAKGLIMNIEIIEQPIRFRLRGLSGIVENERYGEVGMRLMDSMWQAVKSAGIPTTGINHWVYLPNKKMFVGVELRSPLQLPIPDQLEPLEFELTRFLKHLHVGPYQDLPQKWKSLMAELSGRGEQVDLPSLEIYGHHCDDSAKLETTILIGLQPKST